MKKTLLVRHNPEERIFYPELREAYNDGADNKLIKFAVDCLIAENKYGSEVEPLKKLKLGQQLMAAKINYFIQADDLDIDIPKATNILTTVHAYLKKYGPLKNNPTISKTALNKVMVDENLASDIKTEDIEKNMVIWDMASSELNFPSGTYFLFLMEDEVQTELMKSGDRKFPMYPREPIMDNSGFTKFWKNPNAYGVIGHIWFTVVFNKLSNQNIIHVEIMTVREGWKRNGFNRHMIKYLIKRVGINVIDFGLTTREGQHFADKFEEENIAERVYNKVPTDADRKRRR